MKEERMGKVYKEMEGVEREKILGSNEGGGENDGLENRLGGRKKRTNRGGGRKLRNNGEKVLIRRKVVVGKKIFI